MLARSAPTMILTLSVASLGVCRGQDSEVDKGQPPEIDVENSVDEAVEENSFPLFVEEPSEEPVDFVDKNLFYANFGAAYWARLRDLEPRVPFDTSEGFGSFDSWGFGMDLGYQRRLWADDDETSSVWLGGEFGVLTFDERKSFRVRLPKGEVVDDDTDISVTYVALSSSYRHHFGPVSLILGAGLGLYELSVYEEEDSYYGEDEVVRDTDLGGFVSVGLGYELGENTTLTLQDKIHAFHFDDLDSFTPGRDTIDGPLHFIQVGITFRF